MSTAAISVNILKQFSNEESRAIGTEDGQYQRKPIGSHLISWIFKYILKLDLKEVTNVHEGTSSSVCIWL